MAANMSSLLVNVLRWKRTSTRSANETSATWKPFGFWSVRMTRDWTTLPTNWTTRWKFCSSMLPEVSSANTMSAVQSSRPTAKPQYAPRLELEETRMPHPCERTLTSRKYLIKSNSVIIDLNRLGFRGGPGGPGPRPPTNRGLPPNPSIFGYW